MNKHGHRLQKMEITMKTLVDVLATVASNGVTDTEC